jgi:mannitol 2-dehydrogenase
LEDKFVCGRPRWEKAFDEGSVEESVLVVDDVMPYEMMKLRLLNAGHSCLCYPALLVGHRLVDQSLVADGHLEKMLRKYFSEAAPTLDPVPGVDLEAYQESLLHRFKNSKTSDQLERIAQDGSTKFAATLTEALKKMKAQKEAPATASLCLACFAKTLSDPTDDSGGEFKIIELQQPLVEAAKEELSEEATKAFLSIIFGADLLDDYDTFVSLVHKHRVDILKEGGVRAALTALLD